MKAAAPHCIALLGFRASGKSTLGARLAADLRRPFFDLDREIELAQGRTIRELFEQEGEEAFRTIEQETLEGVVVRPGIVLAPGGGVVLRASNRRLLKARCCTVFLDVGADTLVQRLKDDPGRPRLTTAALEEEVATLVARRDPLYRECADLIVAIPAQEVPDATYVRLFAELSA